MDISKYSLEGRVALVTGAGGVYGMGRATALAFAEAGADVAVTDLVGKSENWDLDGTAKEVRRFGRRSLVIQGDLTRKEFVQNMTDKVVQEFGTIDILANVAGVPSNASLTEISEEYWHKGIDINLTSVLLCCQAVGKVMMGNKRGSIINWSSSAAYTMGRLSVYGITKIGIRHLTGWVARELGPYNVRCNGIAPGLINTDFGHVGVDGISNAPTARMNKAMEDRLSEIPLGRMGDASDVADVALFLASDASRYITGVTIPVGGGLTMN